MPPAASRTGARLTVFENSPPSNRLTSPPVADNVVSVLEPRGRHARGDYPALCVAQLDRTGLQTGEGPARMGGLSGPQRQCHPSALGAGMRGIQFLLVAGRARGGS